jgi:hypothetical protein
MTIIKFNHKSEIVIGGKGPVDLDEELVKKKLYF